MAVLAGALPLGIMLALMLWISNEGQGVVPDLVASQPPPAPNAFVLGRDGHALAYADPHGSWLHWLSED